MTDTDHPPPELLKHASHEYFVYEDADHLKRPPSSTGVRLERLGEPKFSIYCTGSFVYGELAQVHTPQIEQAEPDEERMMIRLFEGSPELQSFVRAWIEYCYFTHEAGAEG